MKYWNCLDQTPEGGASRQFGDAGQKTKPVAEITAIAEQIRRLTQDGVEVAVIGNCTVGDVV